jgi:tRNA dimethylallyltransferase
LEIRTILAIVGPTASGKTSLSLLLAEILNGEILSADSRQVYRHLDIGTAKPSVSERKLVPHHFIDILEPHQDYNAGQFGEDVRKVIPTVSGRGKTPILVGGSGLYVKAAIDGIFDGPGKDPEIRERLEEQLRREGLKPLLEVLKRVDPEAFKRMKEITARRVIRALEVFSIAGKPLSDFHAEQSRTADFETVQVSLSWPRAELYSRINKRVDMMMTSGLVGEVEGLQKSGIDTRLNALNTVGYKEVFEYLAGHTSSETMVELIKRNSRRFAKRQTTWFGADKRIHEFKMTGEGNLEVVARKIANVYRRAAKI